MHNMVDRQNSKTPICINISNAAKISIGIGFLISPKKLVAILSDSIEKEISIDEITSLTFSIKNQNDFKVVQKIKHLNQIVLDNQRIISILFEDDICKEQLIMPMLLVNDLRMVNTSLGFMNFNNQTPDSYITSCSIISSNAAGNFQILIPEEIRNNLSTVVGAPVVDILSNTIVGIITNFDKDGKKWCSGISIDQLQKFLPDLTIDILEMTNLLYYQSLSPRISEFNVNSIFLTSSWNSFINSPGWHVTVTRTCQDLLDDISQFLPEQTKLIQLLRNVPINDNYYKISLNLEHLAIEIQKNTIIEKISGQIDRIEKTYKIKLGEIIYKRTRLTKEETKCLKLEKMRHAVITLMEIIKNPLYNRCYLVCGSMGSGKSNFLNQILSIDYENQNRKNIHFIVQIPTNQPIDNFNDIILGTINQYFGINFASLSILRNHFNNLSQAILRLRTEFHEDYSQSFFRLIIAFDDVSLPEYFGKSIIGNLASFIKENTDFSDLYWFLSAPLYYYPYLRLTNLPDQRFWFVYGFQESEKEKKKKAIEDSFFKLENWISIDAVNENEKIGIKMINHAIEEKPLVLDQQLRLDEETSNTPFFRDICNPLVASILIQNNIKELTSSININFLEFMLAYKKLIYDEIIRIHPSQSPTTPITINNLESIGNCIASFLYKESNYSPLVCTVINSITEKLIDEPHSFSEYGEVVYLLRGFGKTRLINLVNIKNPANQFEERIFFTFISYWSSMLASNIWKQFGVSNEALNLFRSRFEKIEKKWQSDVIEYFLLLSDKNISEDNKNIKIFQNQLTYVFLDPQLPDSSLWNASLKIKNQKEKSIELIALGVGKYEKHKIIEGTKFDLFTLLMSIFLFDPNLIPTETKFGYFQRLCHRIHENRFDYVFLFISKHLLKQVQTTTELKQIFEKLSRCDILFPDVIEEIATFSFETLGRIISTSLRTTGDDEDQYHKRITDFLLKFAESIKEDHKNFHEIQAIFSEIFGYATHSKKRILFREWIFYNYILKISTTYGLDTYKFLMSNDWYTKMELQGNQILSKQMEEEANIGIGRLIRNSSNEDNYYRFLVDLLDSGKKVDVRNCAWIIHHSVPHDEGIPTQEMSKELEILLGEIFKRYHKWFPQSEQHLLFSKHMSRSNNKKQKDFRRKKSH